VARRPDMPTPRREARHRPETLLLAAVTGLVCFGIVMVYSTSSATALLTENDPTGAVTRQVLYALAGACGYLVFSRMSPGGLRRLGPVLLAISAVLLVAVLIPGIGTSVNGSRRWISLGGLGNLQPSEIAKLALILWVAQVIAARPHTVRDIRGLTPYFAVFGAIGLLLLLEPDLDGVVVLAGLLAAMLVVAGARLRHLAAAAAVAAVPALLLVMSTPYRRERVLAFLDPSGSAGETGYQALQAQIAVGVGGVSGVGLGDGVQKAFYLPEASTDMILATVGEELGLIGVLALLAGFTLFAVSGFRIALGAADLHQQVVAAGITSMVVVQAVINMGAVLGIIPMAGLTLPFVSYGGSSLIVLLCCTGILVNIGRRSTAVAASGRVVPVGEGRDRGRRDGRARDAGAGGGRRAARAGG
jgi:cell division protein FtsW